MRIPGNLLMSLQTEISHFYVARQIQPFLCTKIRELDNTIYYTLFILNSHGNWGGHFY